MTVHLRHNRVELALHELRGGRGRALLLLHGLGERSPAKLRSELEPWPGPVYALDFTGHGESSVPRGGGYTAEMLMGDADAALAHLGQATLVGRGLGAYVSLLLAGGRAAHVRGAILRDGPGMAGGGSGSTTPFFPNIAPHPRRTPDPFALVELARDIRPADYALVYARMATQTSGLERPLSVCTVERPDWLQAVCSEPGVKQTTFAEALAHYAAL